MSAKTSGPTEPPPAHRPPARRTVLFWAAVAVLLAAFALVWVDAQRGTVVVALLNCAECTSFGAGEALGPDALCPGETRAERTARLARERECQERRALDLRGLERQGLLGAVGLAATGLAGLALALWQWRARRQTR